MRQRFASLALLGAMLAAIVGVGLLAQSSSAALFAQTAPVPAGAADDPFPPPALFERGRSYLVIADCLPTWVAQLAAQSARATEGLNPCFAEIVKVTIVRPDGWIEVLGGGDQRWWINTARLYAFQAAPVLERAASPAPMPSPQPVDEPATPIGGVRIGLEPCVHPWDDLLGGPPGFVVRYHACLPGAPPPYHPVTAQAAR